MALARPIATFPRRHPSVRLSPQPGQRPTSEMEKNRAGNSPHDGRPTTTQVAAWSLSSPFMTARAAPLQLPTGVTRGGCAGNVNETEKVGRM